MRLRPITLPHLRLCIELGWLLQVRTDIMYRSYESMMTAYITLYVKFMWWSWLFDLYRPVLVDEQNRRFAKLQAELVKIQRETPRKHKEALAIVMTLDELRKDEGNTVSIMCDNPNPDEPGENVAVEICAQWTQWKEKRFYGATVLEALLLAKCDRDYRQNRISSEQMVATQVDASKIAASSISMSHLRGSHPADHMSIPWLIILGLLFLAGLLWLAWPVIPKLAF